MPEGTNTFATAESRFLAAASFSASSISLASAAAAKVTAGAEAVLGMGLAREGGLGVWLLS